MKLVQGDNRTEKTGLSKVEQIEIVSSQVPQDSTSTEISTLRVCVCGRACSMRAHDTLERVYVCLCVSVCLQHDVCLYASICMHIYACIDWCMLSVLRLPSLLLLFPLLRFPPSSLCIFSSMFLPLSLRLVLPRLLL